MAEFFNKKEEVIYFEFTPYGRRIVAEGKFRPAFYSFHDSDILYDGQYANVAEQQNQIKDRIKEVPRLKFTIPCKAETNQDKELENGNMPNIELGNLASSNRKNIHPSYEAIFLSNKIASFTGSYTEATGSTFNIPQLAFNYVINETENISDGTVDVEYEPITLYLGEYNAPSSGLNFEYEVYEKEENGRYIRLDSDGGLIIYLDEDVGEYDELAKRVDIARGIDDNRMYWVKALKERATSAYVQSRDDIYDIDDPGEVCD